MVSFEQGIDRYTEKLGYSPKEQTEVRGEIMSKLICLEPKEKK